MTEPSGNESSWSAWLGEIGELCDGIRSSALEAVRREGPGRVQPARAQGSGDVSFALDLACESFIDGWLERQAARQPLSLLTEDRGWRHLGPADAGSGARVKELPDFDHGGPRIALDPIDGTRNLMADLRPAWTVVSFAPAGPSMPRFADLTGGMLSELPPHRASGHRRLWAERGQQGCHFAAFEEDGTSVESKLFTDDDDRPDNGYFSVFRYEPRMRPRIAALEAGFFERLVEREQADARSIYDDQYISNGGQLFLLSLGTYRMIVDPRALLARVEGRPTVTSKPYDVAGALVCAEASGALLSAADGSALDFPLDAETPVHFAGWVNRATHARLEPHWLATLRAEGIL